MKIKSDFITNSSSSSFVVAIAPLETDESNPLHKYVERLIESLFSSWNRVDDDPEKMTELLEMAYPEEYGDCEQSREKFLKSTEGKKVYEKDIENYAEDMFSLLDTLNKDGFIEILRRDY